MNKKEIEEKTVKDKLKIASNRVKFVGKKVSSKIKNAVMLVYLKIRKRLDQHSRISQYKKDIEKLEEEKFIVKNEHFQKISLLETSIEILQNERNELKSKVAVLSKSLDIKINDLIEAKANLLIFEKESEITKLIKE